MSKTCLVFFSPAMILFFLTSVIALRDCDPKLASCTTPPTTWESSSSTSSVSSQLSSALGTMPSLNWINPIQISDIPTIDFDEVMKSVAEQNYEAKLKGASITLPTLPPLIGATVSSVTGDASTILSRAQQIMNMANFARQTTTPSPYQTVSLSFGTLPTFPAKLPIMDYKPDIQKLLTAIESQGPFLSEIDRIIGA